MIRKGIDELLEIGCRLFVPPFITYLAAAQLEAGAIGDALETADLALKFNSEENYHVPETLRLRGEARLKQGDLQMAEADLRQSVEMARTIGAKAWELRTTMALARLLDSDGRRVEPRTMLRRIYNCFSEGFDTPDLKDAEALLKGLAASN